MITIVQKENGFIVEGHANYAEHGRDIVCASVSAISQTALFGLIMHGNASYIQQRGYLDVEIKNPNSKSEVILDTMYAGLRAISAKYPDYVQFKEEEEWLKKEDLRL